MPKAERRGSDELNELDNLPSSAPDRANRRTAIGMLSPPGKGERAWAALRGSMSKFHST